MKIFKQLYSSWCLMATHWRPRPRVLQPAVASQAGLRRELVRVTLRDTLIRHGIPTAWVGSEMLLASGGGKKPGIHLRLLLKHWDARLLTHGVAFEQTFLNRLSLMDPLAPAWINGISWQFALADESGCPAMPDPSLWDVRPAARTATMPTGHASVAAPSAAAKPAVHATVPPPAQTARACVELSRLLAENDATQSTRPASTLKSSQAGYVLFRPTEPAGL